MSIQWKNYIFKYIYISVSTPQFQSSSGRLYESSITISTPFEPIHSNTKKKIAETLKIKYQVSAMAENLASSNSLRELEVVVEVLGDGGGGGGGFIGVGWEASE